MAIGRQPQSPSSLLHARADGYDPLTCPSLSDKPPHLPHADYFEINSTDPKNPAVVACCAPNPVTSVAGCYIWCTVPAAFGNDSENVDAFVACLNEHGWDEVPAIKLGESGSAHMAGSLSVKGLVVLGVVAGWFMTL
ncbi:hypothetical protein F4802DRAFT_597350 [Xylaria palmicola]|nr:hypothetical protein F4802DRAFT_597350 [Xylaria palmicola]